MTGIPCVFTIARVAEILGEDQEWLHGQSMGLDPRDVCLWVLDVSDREVQAFAEDGIECLKEIITDQRADRDAPPKYTTYPPAAYGAYRLMLHRNGSFYQLLTL
ncbi:MAG: hypothetical protein JXQ99_04760 [Hyphomicrobiaceae bacterium]